MCSRNSDYTHLCRLLIKLNWSIDIKRRQNALASRNYLSAEKMLKNLQGDFHGNLWDSKMIEKKTRQGHSAFHYRNFYFLHSHQQVITFLSEWEFQLIKCFNAAPCDQSRKNCQFSPWNGRRRKLHGSKKNGERHGAVMKRINVSISSFEWADCYLFHELF